ncbi:hypothetical protein [Nonomuraea sp. NPDC050643]
MGILGIDSDPGRIVACTGEEIRQEPEVMLMTRTVGDRRRPLGGAG